MKLLLILAALIMLLNNQSESSVQSLRCNIILPPDNQIALIPPLLRALEKEGFQVSTAEFSDTKRVFSECQRQRDSLVILSDCNNFPNEAKNDLRQFLKNGGRLLAIGSSPFSRMAFNVGGAWLDRREALIQAAEQQPLVDLFALDRQSITEWERSTDNPTARSRAFVEHSSREDIGQSLRIEIKNLRSWDVFFRVFSAPIMPPNANVLLFWAKSGAKTPYITIELIESDRSRWYAVIQSSKEWRKFVLTPSDFSYWVDNSSVNRGHSGDQVNFSQVIGIKIGLAQSFAATPQGDHSITVAQFKAGTIKDFYTDSSQPDIETISPSNRLYQYDGIGSIRTASDLNCPKVSISGRFKVACTFARSRGLGISGNHSYRWIPVAHVYDEDENERGCCASVLVSQTDSFPQARWGFIGLDAGLIHAKHQPDFIQLILGMAKLLAQKDMLLNGGADRFCIKSGEPIRLGSKLVSGSNSSGLELNYSIKAEDGADIFSHTPKSYSEIIDIDHTSNFPPSCVIQVDLLKNGKKIDSIKHSLTVKNPPTKQRQFVRIQNGRFYLGNARLFLIGVNYWPNNTAANENTNYFYHWLDPRFYDPQIIQKDLELMSKLGINLVSIQYLALDQANCLEDFLERCNRAGIKAIVYIPGGHPLYPDRATLLKMISAASLSESEALLAYDVAWEPRVDHEGHRRMFDDLWRDWVIERYGSIENAVRDWQLARFDKNGKLTCPSDVQVSKDGHWRVFVSAYRRFWDDEISKGYRKTRQAIRRIDPVHLICARSGYGGTGNENIDHRMQFDLASGAKHLDFISPEGYALQGEWINFRRGGFHSLYARFVSGGKPVFWAEYGYSIWPNSDAIQLEIQRRHIEYTLNMIAESDADGGAVWWWPGGFRTSENSDYGIINPDLTPRPSAIELSRAAKKISQHNKKKTSGETIIEIDRDSNARGYSAVWRSSWDKYADAVADGKKITLKTKGTGSDSSNCPLLAVGNVPCRGSNPPKFLNAEFESVELIQSGKVTFVEKNGEAIVEKGKECIVRVKLGNTAEAKWLAPRPGIHSGSVYLVSLPESDISIKAPIPDDVPFLGDILMPDIVIAPLSSAVNVALTLNADKRSQFGEKFKFKIIPK